MDKIKQLTKRLKPGQDLREEIEKMVAENNIQAGCLISLVGGLSKASLRMAGGEEVKSWDGPFEIVSSTGTVSVNGCHIHVSLSDKEGAVTGGHLTKGCIIKFTAEVVILIFDEARYKRQRDVETGYDELVVG